MMDKRPFNAWHNVSYGIHCAMIEVRKTKAFHEWMASLRDQNAKAKISTRVDRLALGNPGDVKPVGAAISEL